MRTVYAVQTISRRQRIALAGADEGDLPWRDVPGHLDYDSPAKAWAAADEFDAAFEEHSHRVVPRRVEAAPPKPAEPAAPVAPPAKAKPPKPPTLKRQMAEHVAFEGYERSRNALVHGIAAGWAREQLDPFVELCRIHLKDAGSSVRAHHYRKEIEALAADVAKVSHLRVVS